MYMKYKKKTPRVTESSHLVKKAGKFFIKDGTFKVDCGILDECRWNWTLQVERKAFAKASR